MLLLQKGRQAGTSARQRVKTVVQAVFDRIQGALAATKAVLLRAEVGRVGGVNKVLRCFGYNHLIAA